MNELYFDNIKIGDQIIVVDIHENIHFGEVEYIGFTVTGLSYGKQEIVVLKDKTLPVWRKQISNIYEFSPENMTKLLRESGKPQNKEMAKICPFCKRPYK